MTHDIPDTNNTTREHVISRHCWCCPTVDYNAGRIEHHTPPDIVRKQDDEP